MNVFLYILFQILLGKEVTCKTLVAMTTKRRKNFETIFHITQDFLGQHTDFLFLSIKKGYRSINVCY